MKTKADPKLKPMPEWPKQPVGVNVVDLWERDGRTHGNRWWFRIRVKGMDASRAFPPDNWSDGKEWATKKLSELLLTDANTLAAKKAADEFKERQNERAKLSWLIEDFVKTRTKAKKITSTEHSDDMRRVVALAVAEGIDSLTEPDVGERIREFIDTLTDHRTDKAIGDRTWNRHLATFIALVRYAQRIGVLIGNPLGAIERKKVAERIMPYFEVEEVAKLVADSTRTETNAAAWLLDAIELYAGLRSREATWLKFEEIKHAAKLIQVRPPTEEERVSGKRGKRVKNNKAREVDLQPELAAILAAEAKRRFGDLWQDNATGYVFSEAVRGWSSVQHRRALHKLCKDAKVTIGERHVHARRRTFACMRLAIGTDVISLKDDLGHGTLSMSAKYARAVRSMREAVKDWPRDGSFWLRRELPKPAKAEKEAK